MANAVCFRASLYWTRLSWEVLPARWRRFSPSVGESSASLLLLDRKRNFGRLNYERKRRSEHDYFIQLSFVYSHVQSVALSAISHHHVSSWQVEISGNLTRQQMCLVLNILLEQSPVVRCSWVHSSNQVQELHGEYHHMMPDLKKKTWNFTHILGWRPRHSNIFLNRSRHWCMNKQPTFERRYQPRKDFV